MSDETKAPDTHAAEVERLRAVVLEAADLIAEWGSHAGQYFQWKWDLAGDVARIRSAALEQT